MYNPLPNPLFLAAILLSLISNHFSFFVFFFSSRRRHTISLRDWSSDVCSSDLGAGSGDGGFALLAVLLVLTLLGVIGTEFAYSMRLEASMVRSYRDGGIALNLAEAGVQQAIREMLTQPAIVGN